MLLLIFPKCIQGRTFSLLPQDPVGPGQIELSFANFVFYEQYCPPSFVQQPGARSRSGRVATDQITVETVQTGVFTRTAKRFVVSH